MIFGKVRRGFFQEVVFHAEFSRLAFKFTQTGPLVHGQRRLVAGVGTPVRVHPTTQSCFMDAEFLGDLGDRTRCIQGRLDRLLLELRRKRPAVLWQPSPFRRTPILAGSLSGSPGALHPDDNVAGFLGCTLPALQPGLLHRQELVQL